MRKLSVLLLAGLLLAAPIVATAQQNPFPYNVTATLQSAAGATGNGSLLPTGLLSIVTLQTSGTFVGTVTYEATNDGTNFSTLTCYTIGGSSGVTTATAAALVRCNVQGLAGIRARVSAYTSGAITVVASGTSAGFPFAATNN